MSFRGQENYFGVEIISFVFPPPEIMNKPDGFATHIRISKESVIFIDAFEVFRLSCSYILHIKVLHSYLGIVKTFNVRGTSYLDLTRSISWLLKPWLLTSPGHQQPYYWLCRICRSWSYLGKDFKYMCHINEELWHKMWIYVYFPSEKFST